MLLRLSQRRQLDAELQKSLLNKSESYLLSASYEVIKKKK